MLVIFKGEKEPVLLFCVFGRTFCNEVDCLFNYNELIIFLFYESGDNVYGLDSTFAVFEFNVFLEDLYALVFNFVELLWNIRYVTC